MFRTILVPLDGSVFAEHALPLAVAVAKQCGATLRILRVVPPLADYFFMPPLKSDPLDAQLRELHRNEARTYLESIVQRMKDTKPVVCGVMEEEEGVSESICADIVKTGVDLIVMSSHGRGAVERLWLGSIADKLIRTAPVPVLLARPPEHLTAADLHHPVAPETLPRGTGGQYRREAYCRAGGSRLGKLTGAVFTLVRVVRPAFPHEISHRAVEAGTALRRAQAGSGKLTRLNWHKAEDYLRTVAERLRAEGATVQTRVHIAEQPAAAILREAALVGADLIALETHGRGISRLLMGSVADKVVRGSMIPVLVCRLPSQVA